MCNVSIEIKLNNKVIQTVDLDADILLNELNKQQYTKLTQKSTSKPLYTKSKQSDIDRVKAISMTDWINIKSFVKANNIKLRREELGVLSSYIKKGTATEKQARVLMFVLSKVENYNYTPTNPF